MMHEAIALHLQGGLRSGNCETWRNHGAASLPENRRLVSSADQQALQPSPTRRHWLVCSNLIGAVSHKRQARLLRLDPSSELDDYGQLQLTLMQHLCGFRPDAERLGFTSNPLGRGRARPDEWPSSLLTVDRLRRAPRTATASRFTRGTVCISKSSATFTTSPN